MKLLRWLLFLLFLLLLGFGLWWFVPVQPRCTIRNGGIIAGISKDGRRLYLNNEERSRVEIWDTVAGRMVKKIPVRVRHDSDIQISPNEGYLAAIDQSKGALLINAKSGQIRRLPIFGKEKQYLLGICPNDEYVALEQGGIFRFVHCSTLKVISSFSRPPLPSNKGFSLASYLFDPTGRLFLIRRDCRDIACSILIGVRVRDGKTVFSVSSNQAIVIAPNARFFAALEPNGKFFGVWEIASGKQCHKIAMQGVPTVTFSPDNRYLCLAGNSVEVWDLSESKLVCKNSKAEQATFSTDSRLVFLWYRDLYQTVWDLQNANQLWEKTHDGFGSSSAWMNTTTLWQSQFEGKWPIAKCVSWNLFDARSGEKIISLPYDHWDQMIPYDKATPFLLIGRFEQNKNAGKWWSFWEKFMNVPPTYRIDVIDGETGYRYRSLTLATNASLNSPEVRLSADGRTLVTSQATASGGIRVWDLPPRTPWHWVIGIPAAVGAIGLGFSMLLNWRKRRMRAVAST